MEGFLRAYRREDNRRVPLRAEETHGHVQALDIHEPARANLDARIAFAICPHRSIVVHTGGEITEVRRRQCLACRGLKIHHVEGLVGGGNHFVAFQKRIEPAQKLFLRDFACG
jgi:hypothetical protein